MNIVGVNSSEDLKYVEFDDFPILKSNQRRILKTLKRGKITCIKFLEYHSTLRPS